MIGLTWTQLEYLFACDELLRFLCLLHYLQAVWRRKTAHVQHGGSDSAGGTLWINRFLCLADSSLTFGMLAY